MDWAGLELLNSSDSLSSAFLVVEKNVMFLTWIWYWHSEEWWQRNQPCHGVFQALINPHPCLTSLLLFYKTKYTPSNTIFVGFFFSPKHFVGFYLTFFLGSHVLWLVCLFVFSNLFKLSDFSSYLDDFLQGPWLPRCGSAHLRCLPHPAYLQRNPGLSSFVFTSLTMTWAGLKSFSPTHHKPISGYIHFTRYHMTVWIYTA